MNTHASLMDSIYRFQRHIYDPVRKYFLFGRDRLLHEMDIEEGDSILEVGCGTARNLKILSRMYPHSRIYGIDASREMLKTAKAKTKRLNINLDYGLAEDYTTSPRISGSEFDVIFFSYTLTMVPKWKEAVDAAVAALKPGKTLYIVDFCDLKKYNFVFRFLLKRWLRLFHVEFRPETIRYLKSLEKKGLGKLRLKSHMGRYAYLAFFEKSI